MYRVITEVSNSSNKIIEGEFLSFSEAKSYLYKSFNNKMWSGNICSWSNQISYFGKFNGNDIKTYIKKL